MGSDQTGNQARKKKQVRKQTRVDSLMKNNTRKKKKEKEKERKKKG